MPGVEIPRTTVFYRAKAERERSDKLANHEINSAGSDAFDRHNHGSEPDGKRGTKSLTDQKFRDDLQAVIEERDKPNNLMTRKEIIQMIADFYHVDQVIAENHFY